MTEAQKLNFRKLIELTKGREWVANFEGFTARACFTAEGLLEIRWNPQAPDENNAEAWAAYVGWLGEILKSLRGVRLAVVDEIAGVRCCWALLDEGLALVAEGEVAL